MIDAVATLGATEPNAGVLSLGCPESLTGSDRSSPELSAECSPASTARAGADSLTVNTCSFIGDAIKDSQNASVYGWDFKCQIEFWSHKPGRFCRLDLVHSLVGLARGSGAWVRSLKKTRQTLTLNGVELTKAPKVAAAGDALLAVPF